MNFCKDCRYMSNSIAAVPICQHDNAVDPVHGQMRLSCAEARKDQTLCGREGRWFMALSAKRFEDVPLPDFTSRDPDPPKAA